MELGPILRAASRNKPRFGLLVVQIAVTLAIVANCLTLILDARRKMSRPPAFDEENLIEVALLTADPALRDDGLRAAWFREATASAKAIPGVRAVSLSYLWIWESYNRRIPVKAVGSDAVGLDAALVFTDENFPDTVGVEVDEGRWFTRDEVKAMSERARASRGTKPERTSDGKVHEPEVVDVVVSRALAERVFGEGSLVGKMLEGPGGDHWRIIGVIRTFYVPSVLSGHEEYAVFRGSTYISPEVWGSPLLIRAEPGRAPSLVPIINERLAYTGGPASSSRWAFLVSDRKNQHFKSQRMTAALMALLIVLLVFVAALGVAGLASFSVTERTRQIGIRRALGASATDIVRYFLIESALVTTIGLGLGAALAVLLNMALLRIFDGAKLGPGIVAGSALLLWFVALGAALPPALRASRISPVIATRNV